MLHPPQTFVSWLRLIGPGLTCYKKTNQIPSLGTKHWDAGVQSKLLDARDKYSEIFNMTVFAPPSPLYGLGE